MYICYIVVHFSKYFSVLSHQVRVGPDPTLTLPGPSADPGPRPAKCGLTQPLNSVPARARACSNP